MADAPKHQLVTEEPAEDSQSETQANTTEAPKHQLVTVEPVEKVRGRRLWIIPAALAGLVSAAYIGGSVYFMSHFMPNTTVNGADVSYQPASQLAESISQSADDFSATVKGAGFEIPLTAADIDYAYDGNSCAESALSQQNPWTWPLSFNESQNLTVEPEATYNAEKAWSLFEPFVEEGKQKQGGLANQGVYFDEASDHYIVDPQVHNAMLDHSLVISAIDSGIESGDSTIEIGEDCYKVDPETQKRLDNANFYCDAKIHLTMNGVDAIDIDGKQINSWLTVNEDGTVTLDEQAVLDYGPGELSDLLDSVGKPRTYTRPDGEEITVEGGTYGWLIDGAASSQLILEALKSGKAQTVEIPTFQNADRVDPGGQDWPDTYVDVDISEQLARVYVDGEFIMDADLVTGIPDSKYETPRGVYYITEHEEQVDLYNPGNVPEGVTPQGFEIFEGGWYSHVDYWMAFIDSSTGLHNSDWRTVYGRDYDGDLIYLYNGSHGCINMSYDDAQQMYGLTELGDAVIVHD